MQPHSVSLISPLLIYLLFLFWGVIIALLPQSAPKRPIRVGVRQENERLGGTLRRAIYSNYKTSEETRVAGCLPMFLSELLCIYFFHHPAQRRVPHSPCMRSRLPHIYCHYFLFALWDASLHCPPSCSRIFMRFFFCLFVFSQTSQNAHQNRPAGCPPILPEEICGWFLSKQQVSWTLLMNLTTFSISDGCIVYKKCHSLSFFNWILSRLCYLWRVKWSPGNIRNLCVCVCNFTFGCLCVSSVYSHSDQIVLGINIVCYLNPWIAPQPHYHVWDSLPKN